MMDPDYRRSDGEEGNLRDNHRRAVRRARGRRGNGARAGTQAVPSAPVPHDTHDDPTRPRRTDWATLLRRSWAIEALRCPRCAGRMDLIAAIDDEAIARR